MLECKTKTLRCVVHLLALALLVTPAAARAESKRILVIEVPQKAFKGLGKGVRAALQVNHGYKMANYADFVRERKKREAAGALKADQIQAVAKSIGADLVVYARASPNGKGGFSIDVRADRVDGTGTIYTGTFTSAKPRLDRVTATDIGSALRDADLAGQSKGKGAADMEFSFDDAGAGGAGADKGMDFGEEAVAGLKPNEKAAAKPKPEDVIAEESTDEEGEDEFFEPTEEVADGGPQPRYVSPDGRAGLVVDAGLAMALRSSLMSSSNGAPPTYQGVLSPGFAFGLQLFPRRFREGGREARNFGVFARGQLAFMPSEYVVSGQAQNNTDSYLNVQGGLIYRHVFGMQEKSIAVGAQAGVAYEQLTVASNVPFPSVTYISPLLAGEVEVPVMQKYIVLVGRLNVMPYTALSQQAVRLFGTRKWAFGVGGAVGVHSIIYDTLYLEAMGTMTSYLQSFTGAGQSGYKEVAFRELIGGFTVAAGVAY